MSRDYFSWPSRQNRGFASGWREIGFVLMVAFAILWFFRWGTVECDTRDGRELCLMRDRWSSSLEYRLRSPETQFRHMGLDEATAILRDAHAARMEEEREFMWQVVSQIDSLAGEYGCSVLGAPDG